MAERFSLIDQKVVYREMRRSSDGEELRWVLTHETMRDEETGVVFERTFLRHSGVAAVAPITSSGEVLLIEQFRYSAKRSLWEIPAGMLRGDFRNGEMIPIETPEEAAARELSEEAGYCAGRLELAQQFYTMPGTSGGLVFLFLAFDLEKKASAADVGEVVFRVEPFKIERALEMIASGEICDAKTILGIQNANLYRERCK